MTLLMRDIENEEKGIEKGIRQGIKQGIRQGKIYGAVSVYKDMGLSDCEISQKIQEKYELTKEEAEQYLFSDYLLSVDKEIQ